MKKYRLTVEHEQQLRPWAERWIANALNCDSLSDKDKTEMKIAIGGLNKAAGLRDHGTVVFVSSPPILMFATSLAVRIIEGRRKGMVKATETAATGAATWEATRAATEEATEAATEEATEEATWEATWEATRAATWEATREATEAATWEAMRETMWSATKEAWYKIWNGGNQWSGWPCYISFFRHIAKLNLPIYDRWQHYEVAAIHGGPRCETKYFCLVSDRPEFIRMDSRNLPHCEFGPFCRWRDGWSLYYWHGIAVPEQVIMKPHTLTMAQILGEKNVEVKRVMIERYGNTRFLLESGAKLIDKAEIGELYTTPTTGNFEPLTMVRVWNSTPEPDGSRHEYYLRVPPSCKTAREAVAWTFNKKPEDYQPKVET